MDFQADHLSQQRIVRRSWAGLRPASAVLFVLLASTIGQADGGDEPAGLARYEQAQTHMGTLFRIVFYSKDEATATRAADAAFRRIAELDSIMSDYRDDSELTLLSRSSGGPAKPLSHDLFLVLKRSQEVAALSEGAFDVTIGPAVRQWRRARRVHRLPTPEQIAGALERVGWKKLTIDYQAKTAELAVPGMILDLGGIAKGFAGDEAIKAMKRCGVDRAMVICGGAVTVSRPPPGKDGWTIELSRLATAGQSQEKRVRPVAETVVLRDATIATSGDASQFIEFDGVRYSHIVDPKTGIGLTNRIQVSVIAPDGMTADAFGSAISVLGPEKGMALVEKTPSVAALILRETVAGVERITSKDWPQEKR